MLVLLCDTKEDSQRKCQIRKDLFFRTVGSQCGSVKVAVTKAGTKGSPNAGSVQ